VVVDISEPWQANCLNLAFSASFTAHCVRQLASHMIPFLLVFFFFFPFSSLSLLSLSLSLGVCTRRNLEVGLGGRKVCQTGRQTERVGPQRKQRQWEREREMRTVESRERLGRVAHRETHTHTHTHTHTQREWELGPMFISCTLNYYLFLQLL